MGRLKLWLPVITGIAVAVVLALFYPGWQHWIALHTGSLNNSSTPPNYNYWSGFGSVFPWSMGVVTGLWVYVWQHTKKSNCHTHGCWRIGSYPVGDYRVCKKCHLEVKGTHPTIEHLRSVHLAYGGSRHDQGIDSESGRGERTPGTVNFGGVPGHDQPADAAGAAGPADS
jgi:hypothetical protein